MPVRQTITVDASLKIAALQETVTVTGASPTIDVENTKVGARLDHEILQAVPTSRTIFGSTTVLPGMTMVATGSRQASTRRRRQAWSAHGAVSYNLNYYGVTADTPQNYGSMYYMDFGSAEEISVDTARDGRRNRRRRRRQHQRRPEIEAATRSEASSSTAMTGKALLERLYGQQHHRRPARARHHRPHAAESARLQRQHRRADRQGPPMVLRFDSANYTHDRRHGRLHDRLTRTAR